MGGGVGGGRDLKALRWSASPGALSVRQWPSQIADN